MASLVYLDASAVVKLVVEEGESPALRGAPARPTTAHIQRLLTAAQASGLSTEEPR